MDMKTLGLRVLVSLVTLTLQTRDTESVECRGVYYKASRIQSATVGFCWYFFNGDFRASTADSLCRQYDGRLPAVNSDTKAGRLAQFASDMRELYYNGTFHHSWPPLYASGWQGLTLWGDRVRLVDDQWVWATSGAVVSYQSYDDADGLLPVQGPCTVFNMSSGTWRFSSCEGVNTVMCEETGHDYEAEEPDEETETEATDAPVGPTTVKTVLEEKYDFVADECPPGFELTMGRCLLLGRVSGIFAANKTCLSRHGHLPVITNANDEQVLGQFVKDKKKNRQWNNFLSPVLYKNDEFVWVSTGQSAAYVADKLYLIPRPSFLFDNLLILTPEGTVTTCDRHTCNAQAFCQANDDEYYAYDDEYVTVREFLDFEDI